MLCNADRKEKEKERYWARTTYYFIIINKHILSCSISLLVKTSYFILINYVDYRFSLIKLLLLIILLSDTQIDVVNNSFLEI